MLSKQLVPLAFSQGIDTKIDKKQQLFGTLRRAENAVFETLNSVRKRNGYDAIVPTATDGSLIGFSEYLTTFKNELLLFGAEKLYGFSTSLQKFEPKGSAYSVFVETNPVLNNSYDQDYVDFAICDGLKFYAFHNATTNAVGYSVQDGATNTMLVTDQLVAAGASKPQIVTLGTRVYILYAIGNNVHAKFVECINPSALSAQFTVVSNLEGTNKLFDAVSISGRVIVAYQNSSNVLTLVFFTSNNTPSTPVPIGAESASQAIDCFVDSTSKLVVSYVNASNVKYFVYLANFSGFAVSPTIIAGSSAATKKVAAAENAINEYIFFYSTETANPATDSCAFKQMWGSFFVSDLQRGVSLAARPFKYNDIIYVPVTYSTEIQPTHFLIALRPTVDPVGTIAAKINQGTSGGRVAGGVLAQTFVEGTNALVPLLYKTKFAAQNGDFVSLRGVVDTKFLFADSQKYENARLGNNLIVAGGYPQIYDGETVVEQGFAIFPEAPVLTALTSGTASNWPSLAMANSATPLVDTYGYCAVYRWTDHQGQEHRSAPSEVVNIGLDSGLGQIGVQVQVRNLWLTNKKNLSVVIEIYRTELNGTIFYLANNIETPLFSNKFAGTFATFIDGKPDVTGTPPNEVIVLATGRALYTTGGVLENISAPSAKILATHTASQRIFLAGLENVNELQYSKIAAPGQPVEFNDSLRIPIDPRGGPITALASMDEKLVIFEQDAMFFMGGTGPNNLGEQNSFTTPELLSTDIGCVEQKSVVLTPDGLMFKSRKGIFLLSRGLQLTYIGAPVEEYNSLVISSSQVVGELNQVRFTTTNGLGLVYNYVFRFWSTFTNHEAKSAVVIQNDYYYLRQNNVVFKENRDSFSDAGSPIKLRVEIGWISFAILQGYSRLYKMLLLGNWYSPHKLLVRVGYDFNETWLQSALMDPATSEIQATAYGNDSPYGLPATVPYGGTGDAYQVRFNFKRQKCQSVKLLIEDVQENAGEGFSLSQITFQVGGKAGLFKMAKNKSVAIS